MSRDEVLKLQEMVKQWVSREISSYKIFEGDHDFDAINKAETYAKENGFSFGSMQRGAPMAMYRGIYIVSKWRNLDRQDIAEIDGLILADSFRNGPIYVVILKEIKA